MNVARRPTPERLQRLSGFGWYAVGLFARLFRLERALWKKRVLSPMSSLSWQAALTEVHSREAFFKSIPYRPSYDSPFDQEKLFVKIALAVANFYYFRSDLKAYIHLVRRVGSYLDHAMTSNAREVHDSDVWADYLHHKASIESIFGQSAKAACLNSEVKQLCSQKHGRIVDALTYEGCTMCCRVESLTADEDYLLTALDSQILDLLRRLEALPRDQRPVDNASDFYTPAFYISILRCKIQAHARYPNVAAIESAIEQAKRFREHIDGPERDTYDVVVPFYEALLSMFKKESVKQTTALYDKSLEALQNSRVPYFCLLRVPDRIALTLANHVQREQISSDRMLTKLKRQKGRTFAIKAGLLFFAAIIAPPGLNYLAPFAQLLSRFPSARGVWFTEYGLTTGCASVVVWAMKRLSERHDRGLVSPVVLSWVDIVGGFYLVLAVTLFGAAASEIITSAP